MPKFHAGGWVQPAASHHTKLSAAKTAPLHLLSPFQQVLPHHRHLRHFTTTTRRLSNDHDESSSPAPKLTHLTPTGAAHMVPIAHKSPTTRTARAVCAVHFSTATALHLIRANALKKGDVLGVARVAGIMAAKRTPDLIPLCHPILLSHVGVELTPNSDSASGGDEEAGWRVDVAATVTCDGRTGVEMEALTAAMAAALTVYDMCKAVDRGMRIEGLRVVLKEGGRSGRWVEGMPAE